jgi:hypothetical protein
MQEFKMDINQVLLSLPRSATLEINEESKRLIASGKKVYKFGFGQSPFPVPEVRVNVPNQFRLEGLYCFCFACAVGVNSYSTVACNIGNM